MERRLIKTAQNLRTDQYKRINIDNIGLIYHNIGQEKRNKHIDWKCEKH